jgi:hypothetical protein
MPKSVLFIFAVFHTQTMRKINDEGKFTSYTALRGNTELLCKIQELSKAKRSLLSIAYNSYGRVLSTGICYAAFWRPLGPDPQKLAVFFNARAKRVEFTRQVNRI